MATTVTMPQLGETVTEGTILRWAKKVGDSIAVDEILVEISTDKVDTEVPSPAAGVVTELLVGEGETVAVGTALAVIGEAGEAQAPKRLRRRRAARQTPDARTGGTSGCAGRRPSPWLRRLSADARLQLRRSGQAAAPAPSQPSRSRGSGGTCPGARADAAQLAASAHGCPAADGQTEGRGRGLVAGGSQAGP